LETRASKSLAKTLTHALAIGLAGVALTPALADTGAVRTAEVRYDDLDLTKAAGQRTLERRIEAAARQVCRATNVQTGTQLMDRQARDCLARAHASAKQQVALRTAETQRGG
jgi:UrcA family protein